MTSLIKSKNETGESHLLTQDPTGYVRFALKVEKTAPIIDADRQQAQAAVELQVGKQIGQINRRAEGKSWHIIGKVGSYLKIQTKNSAGTTRLIRADDYLRPDRYRSQIAVYKYPTETPIIDVDARQIAVVCPTAQEIPSESNARELGILDFLHALDRVALCQSADAAKIMIERALLTGYMTLSVGEVVRAIEMRLPAATPSQVDELSLIRSKLTGDVKICRVLGAFGDRVLVLTHGPEDRGIPRTVLNLSASSPAPSAPSWDVTRPAERRVWYIPTEGISPRSQEAA